MASKQFKEFVKNITYTLVLEATDPEALADFNKRHGITMVIGGRAAAGPGAGDMVTFTAKRKDALHKLVRTFWMAGDDLLDVPTFLRREYATRIQVNGIGRK